MPDEVTDLLDRQYEYLCRQDGAQFLVGIPRLLAVLRDEPRLMALLEDIVGRHKTSCRATATTMCDPDQPAFTGALAGVEPLTASNRKLSTKLR